MLSVRPICLAALAILVAAFVALYPYLEGMDRCMVGECPYAMQSSHGASIGSVAACVSAVLAASVVLFFAMLRGRRIFAAYSRPMELYLSPDPPPPRLSPSL